MPHTITENCNGCGACARLCPASAISGEKKKLHSIDAVLCIDCGACGRTCPQSAVLDTEDALCIMMKRSEWPKPEMMSGPVGASQEKRGGCLPVPDKSENLHRLRILQQGMPGGQHYNAKT
ncbi:MAG: hypothetical protein CVU51_15335 [Deltaproteobacteria bacterium HGW-Deltaproteobacteria-1]|nr:MAG: hypothetical protein CVU51_15335 [Deltaproteobacteria bacterium HGW-Deltaproteobacteria-1]